MEQEEWTPGRRLEAYIQFRWSRKQGGIEGLARQMGVSKETIYQWFRGDGEPSLNHLARLGEQFGVERYEILAAMDGFGPVVRLDQTSRAFVVDEIRRVMAEGPGPLAQPRGSTDG